LPCVRLYITVAHSLVSFNMRPFRAVAIQVNANKIK
jgi:hypothetical protein